MPTTGGRIVCLPWPLVGLSCDRFLCFGGLGPRVVFGIDACAKAIANGNIEVLHGRGGKQMPMGIYDTLPCRSWWEYLSPLYAQDHSSAF